MLPCLVFPQQIERAELCLAHVAGEVALVRVGAHMLQQLSLCAQTFTAVFTVVLVEARPQLLLLVMMMRSDLQAWKHGE